MKKILSLSCLFIASAFYVSCSESDNVADQVLDNTVYGGGNLRTVTPITSPNIQLGNATANFSVNVEVQDLQNGQGTEKIDVYVSFIDNNPADGNNTKVEGFLKSIPASAFVPGTRELPHATIAVTLNEFKTRLVLTNAQFTGGDQFRVRLAQVLKDGRVFTNTNAAPPILGGAYFNSPFLYNANVVCPITESLAGVHSYSSTNMRRGTGTAPGSLCAGVRTGTVTWTALPLAGDYSTNDYSFGMFAYCWGDSPATSAGARLTWFCNKLVAKGTDQYGDAYTYTLTSAAVGGTTITLNWINTYFDSGTTTITRAGGANWPAILGN